MRRMAAYWDRSRAARVAHLVAVVPGRVRANSPRTGGDFGGELISYAAFSSALFYVTLLYQDVYGWSVLRTGVSWLFINVPFLVMAQLAGRLDSWFSARTVITTGCLVAAIGVLALSTASPATPTLVRRGKRDRHGSRHRPDRHLPILSPRRHR